MMNIKIGIYLYSGTLLSNKKPWTTDIYNNVNDSHQSYVEGKKPDNPPQKN